MQRDKRSDDTPVVCRDTKGAAGRDEGARGHTRAARWRPGSRKESTAQLSGEVSATWFIYRRQEQHLCGAYRCRGARRVWRRTVDVRGGCVSPCRQGDSGGGRDRQDEKGRPRRTTRGNGTANGEHSESRDNGEVKFTVCVISGCKSHRRSF